MSLQIQTSSTLYSAFPAPDLAAFLLPLANDYLDLPRMPKLPLFAFPGYPSLSAVFAVLFPVQHIDEGEQHRRANSRVSTFKIRFYDMKNSHDLLDIS